tara:strand:- start:272 stop:481 length:210 start_codon:yes stop_codon:yes gene_type:complete
VGVPEKAKGGWGSDEGKIKPFGTIYCLKVDLIKKITGKSKKRNRHWYIYWLNFVISIMFHNPCVLEVRT